MDVIITMDSQNTHMKTILRYLGADRYYVINGIIVNLGARPCGFGVESFILGETGAPIFTRYSALECVTYVNLHIDDVLIEYVDDVIDVGEGDNSKRMKRHENVILTTNNGTKIELYSERGDIIVTHKKYRMIIPNDYELEFHIGDFEFGLDYSGNLYKK
jgi:hypothetical protein